MDTYTEQALNHIRYLSQVIGGRGSCTPKMRKAGSCLQQIDRSTQTNA